MTQRRAIFRLVTCSHLSNVSMVWRGYTAPLRYPPPNISAGIPYLNYNQGSSSGVAKSGITPTLHIYKQTCDKVSGHICLVRQWQWLYIFAFIDIHSMVAEGDSLIHLYLGPGHQRPTRRAECGTAGSPTLVKKGTLFENTAIRCSRYFLIQSEMYKAYH